jgi:hypothetical protein
MDFFFLAVEIHTPSPPPPPYFLFLMFSCMVSNLFLLFLQGNIFDAVGDGPDVQDLAASKPLGNESLVVTVQTAQLQVSSSITFLLKFDFNVFSLF